VQFGQPIVPPAPPIAGDQTATELLEHYWASLLRDVAFTDYGSNSMAAMAAAELSALPTYLGPRDSHGQVTTNLLFRGGFPGEALGPYVSQFLITPTSFGAQSLSQQMVSYLPTIDYMTTFSDWLTVQNGNGTGLQNHIDPMLRYMRNGPRPGSLHPCGRSVSGLFRSLPRACRYRCAAESWESVHRFEV